MKAYAPPKHIILRRHTDAITDGDLVFLQLALQRQLRDVAKAYKLKPPGVTLVTPDAEIPTTEAVGLDFVDDDGLDGAIGHHGWLPGADFPWALVGCKESPMWTVTASHEACEYFMNLRLDRYVVGPEDWRWPMEICDMVEDHYYPVSVTVLGQSRDVMLSDWVLPSFWDANGRYPYDQMRVLRQPFDVAEGGYALVERNGYLVSVGSSERRARKRATSRVEWLRDQTWPGRR